MMWQLGGHIHYCTNFAAKKKTMPKKGIIIQPFPFLLRNFPPFRSFNKSLPLDPILSQINLVYISVTNFSKAHFNIIIYLLQGLWTKILYTLLHQIIMYMLWCMSSANFYYILYYFHPFPSPKKFLILNMKYKYKTDFDINRNVTKVQDLYTKNTLVKTNSM